MRPLAAHEVIGGRFRLNRLLGRGAMGQVWHATLLSLDTPCAVKFIDGEFAAQAEPQARFEREAKAAAQLRSPHVVQILEHGISDGRPYIAMELLEGEDLRKRLKRQERLSREEVLSIATQVGRALTKAHGAGIVHRDLKPDNIFLVPDDDREVVKVLDFGMAKSLGEGGFTRAGAMIGTPYYVSPEQAQGSKNVDHRTDLWALSVIVFQCLTGRRPFASQSLGELLMQIMVHDPPVPSSVSAEVPPGFDAWWQRAVARDPAKRFQSARELVEGLAAAFDVEAPQADPAPAAVKRAPASTQPVSIDPRAQSATRPLPSADDTQRAPPLAMRAAEKTGGGTQVLKMIPSPDGVASFQKVVPTRPLAATMPLAAVPNANISGDWTSSVPGSPRSAHTPPAPRSLPQPFVPSPNTPPTPQPMNMTPPTPSPIHAPSQPETVRKKSELHGAMGVVIACMALIFGGLVIASYVFK